MRLPAGDAELVQIMDANLADAARRAGPHLACRIGCTQCCHGVFAINMLDALRLRAALHAAAPATATVLRERARAWIASYGANFPGDATTGVLGASEQDQERFEGFANEAACPALDPETGRCDVYTGRPMTCRVFGPPVRSVDEDGNQGLGHCELCFTAAAPEEIEACAMPVPHEFEARLLEETGSERQTVVAYALVSDAMFLP